MRRVRRGLLDRPDRPDPRRGSGRSAVPADAVTASGSGLDPHISPAYADLQVNRVAKARGVSPDQIREAVRTTPTAAARFLGEPGQRAAAQHRTGPNIRSRVDMSGG